MAEDPPDRQGHSWQSPLVKPPIRSGFGPLSVAQVMMGTVGEALRGAECSGAGCSGERGEVTW